MTLQIKSRRKRLALFALLLLAVLRLPVFTAQSADLFGSKALKTTGEQPSKEVSTGVPQELVPAAQKPAAEIEDQIKNFQGQRSPGFSPIELSGHERNNGTSTEIVIDSVDPNGPFADKRPGDVLDKTQPEPPATQPSH